MNWQQLMDRAFQHFSAGDYSQASQDYRRVVDELQSSRDASIASRARVLVQLGYCYLYLGHADDAAKAFGQCPQQVDEYDVQIRRMVGNSMVAVLRGSLDVALQTMKQVPSYSDQKSSLGLLVKTTLATKQTFGDLCQRLAEDYSQRGGSDQSAHLYDLARQAYTKSLGAESALAVQCAQRSGLQSDAHCSEGWKCDCGESNELQSHRCLRCFKAAPFITLCPKCNGTTAECNCWRVENPDTGGFMFS